MQEHVVRKAHANINHNVIINSMEQILLVFLCVNKETDTRILSIPTGKTLAACVYSVESTGKLYPF